MLCRSRMCFSVEKYDATAAKLFFLLVFVYMRFVGYREALFDIYYSTRCAMRLVGPVVCKYICSIASYSSDTEWRFVSCHAMDTMVTLGYAR